MGKITEAIDKYKMEEAGIDVKKYPSILNIMKAMSKNAKIPINFDDLKQELGRYKSSDLSSVDKVLKTLSKDEFKAYVTGDDTMDDKSGEVILNVISNRLDKVKSGLGKVGFDLANSLARVAFDPA